MRKTVLSMIRVMALLVLLVAAFAPAAVYADSADCFTDPGQAKCKDPTGSFFQQPGNDAGNEITICGNGGHTGNPHCQEAPPNEPPVVPPPSQPGGPAGPSKGTGPGSAPRTGSIEGSVVGSLARVGTVATLLLGLLAVTFVGWRKSRS